MADTPLSSQMESEYKVAKWNRSTVADGSWLQKYTIEKLKDRDIFLANQIDKIKGATDVIAVFGTYEEFTAASAGDWQQTVTDNDFIKVLRDDTYQPTGDEDEGTHDDDYYQVYYEWHDNTEEHHDWTGWSAIGELDPYYSKSEFNIWSAARFNNLSANWAISATNSEKLGGVNANEIFGSAKSGANASAWLNTNAIKYISNVASSNMQYIDGTLATANDGSARKLTISLSGYQTTGDGTYITGSTNNRLITLKPSNSFIGSAQSGKSAYDWITTKSATLSAGQYIQFTQAAPNTLGISVSGIVPYTNGNYIEVDNTTHKINLSSDISATHISSDNITFTGYYNRGFTGYMDCSSMSLERYGQPGEKVIITPYDVSAYVPNGSQTIIATNSWYTILSNLGGNFVSAASSQQINVVTALELPTILEEGVYYLV